MFKLLTNLTKATVAVAVSPIAVVADIVAIPVTACDPRYGHPFNLTDKCLKQAGEAFSEAVKPE